MNRDDDLTVSPGDVHTEPHPSVGGFVLGSLGDETAAFILHLGNCSVCDAAVADLAPLAELLDLAAPKDPELPAPPPFAPPTRRHRVWVPFGGAALGVAAAVTLGLWVTSVRDTGASTSLALAAPSGEATGTARFALGADGSTIELSVRSLPALREGERYECWWTTAKGVELSAGSFRVSPSGDADVDLHVAADLRNAGRLRVTLEPGDGDPAPSAEVVLDHQA